MAFLFVDQNSSANPSKHGEVDKTTRRHISRHVMQYAYSRQGPWRRKKLPSRTRQVPVGWRIKSAEGKDTWDTETSKSLQARSRTTAESPQEQVALTSSKILSSTHIRLDGLRTDPFSSLPVSSEKFIILALEQCEAEERPTKGSKH